VTLTFTNATNTVTLLLKDQDETATTIHSFNINPANLVPDGDPDVENATASTLPDRVYKGDAGLPGFPRQPGSVGAVAHVTVDTKPPDVTVPDSINIPAGPTGTAVLGNLKSNVTATDNLTAVPNLTITQDPQRMIPRPSGWAATS